MLKPGDKAPDFVLANDEGVDTSLTDLLNNGPLILYFYPADFTPGCTREACSIRDIHQDIQAVGLTVVGISPQDVDSHRKFREKYGLPFTLLSDPNKEVIRMYDVDGMFGVGVQRATFLISQDREIQDAVIANVRIARHAEFIERAVALRETAGKRG
jgi:peroxiredoxin Q/BCP